MNRPDHPRKASSRTGKTPRTIRQQLEHDAWTNHYRMASRIAGRARQFGQSLSEPGLTETGLAKNGRSLSRQNRTLLAVSLVLLVLLLFARASAAQEQTQEQTLAQARAQEFVVDGEVANHPGAEPQGFNQRGIEFRSNALPRLGPADRLNPVKLNSGACLPLAGAAEKLQPGEIASPLPVGSSVNLASFSSTATGWKSQLAYSLATLLSAASLLWFSTPSRRVQVGG